MVVLCTVRVDLAELRRQLKGAPKGGRGARALDLLAQGRVRVWVHSEYQLAIGGMLRKSRIEKWLRDAWPTPGEDPLSHPACRAYIEAAGIEINPPDVHERFVDPAGILWFRAPGTPWRAFRDASLVKAYVTSELVRQDQDPDFQAALVRELDRLLAG